MLNILNNFWKILRGVFSLSFVKSFANSFGYYIYEHVLWRQKINLSGSARIHPTASLRKAENIYVGKNSHINHNCCLWADQNSSIKLGDNLLMGPGVKIFSSNHGTDLNQSMTFQPRQEADIIIGDDVWLGANSIVLAGVEIKSGTIVAAGSVVTKDLPANVIAGGVRGEVLKQDN